VLENNFNASDEASDVTGCDAINEAAYRASSAYAVCRTRQSCTECVGLDRGLAVANFSQLARTKR